MLVAEDLHLDVTGRGDELLRVHSRVAEEAQCFALDSLQRGAKILRPLDQPHPLPAAAGARFDHDRISGFGGEAIELFEALHRPVHTGNDGNSRRTHPSSSLDFGAHRVDRLGRGSYEEEPRIPACAREGSVLREKAVPRMDCLRAGAPGCVNDSLDPEIALRGRCGPDPHRPVGVEDVQRGPIRFGVDGNRLVVHLATGADDSDCDLAAVRNEDSHRTGDSTGARSGECGMRNGGWGVRNGECGMRVGMRSNQWTATPECEGRSADDAIAVIPNGAKRREGSPPHVRLSLS